MWMGLSPLLFSSLIHFDCYFAGYIQVNLHLTKGFWKNIYLFYGSLHIVLWKQHSCLIWKSHQTLLQWHFSMQRAFVIVYTYLLSFCPAIKFFCFSQHCLKLCFLTYNILLQFEGSAFASLPMCCVGQFSNPSSNATRHNSSTKERKLTCIRSFK